MITRVHCSLRPPFHRDHNPPILHGFNPQKTLASSTSLPVAPSPSPSPLSSDSGLRFRQKLLHLERLNVDSAKALEKNPNFRSAPLDRVISVEKCLRQFGIQRSDMGRIFGMLPQLLTADPRSDLYPVFDFLITEVEIPFPDLRRSVNRCPRLLISGVEDQLRPTHYFLRSLGFVGPHKITCQTTLLLVSSVETTLLPKLEYLQSLGFSRRETVRMVLRSPGLLTFSIQKNFVPKVEYFLNEMNGDLRELKEFPQYFSFSLERKIKPRHQLLVEHGLSLRLPEMLKVSDGEFSDRLVEMRLRLVDEKFSLQHARFTIIGNFPFLETFLFLATCRTWLLDSSQAASSHLLVLISATSYFCYCWKTTRRLQKNYFPNNG